MFPIPLPVSPRLAIAAVVVGLVASALVVQQLRISDLKAKLAESESQLAKSEAAAADSQVRYMNEMIAARNQHVKQTKEKDTTYAKKLQTIERERATERADADRVRSLLQGLQQGVSPEPNNEAGASASNGATDQRNKLATLLEESVGLLDESREVVKRRDAEVGRLLEQIAADRASCHY